MWRSLMLITVASLAVALLAGTVFAAPAQVQMQTVPLQQIRPVEITRLSPSVMTQEFGRALQAHDVADAKRQAALQRFQQLPSDLQASLLSAFDANYAEAMLRPDIHYTRINPELIGRIVVALFRINSFWPGQGAPGSWSYAFGSGFNDNCKVYFDGVQVESNYLGMDIEFFPNSMAFKVPAGATRDAMHNVFVRNMTSNVSTATVQYEVVAPRGYRGYYGWKFSNFSRASIDWKLYRNYFGAGAVEYPNGTHRPAAQAWFDNTYTKAGSGGNCYGMSVSSLRVRNHEFDHMYHSNYFTNPGTTQPWVWWYDWNDTTRETVQQQQGGWYTQEILDVHTNLYNTQTPRDIYNRCASLVGNVVNRPVLVVWGNGWGHAVVPYKCEVDGNTRHIRVYDNNNPYRENETGSIDPNEATVNWSANTFAFGSAPKGVAMSYDECTPANPHLPGGEYGGPGAQALVVAISENTQIQQITDQQGHRFFNADGTPNEDPNTRIPFSMRMFPLTQPGPIMRVPQMPTILRPELALARPSGPTLFVFSQPTGMTLNFNIAGQGAKQVSFFTAGRIFEVDASGMGELKLQNIGALPAVQIQNPQALQPTSLRFIRSREGGDRLFSLTGLQNLGAQSLRLLPSDDGRSFELQAAMGARFNVELQGPLGQGIHSASFQNVALQSGNAMTLSPQNWGQLSQSPLNVQFRNLQTNQMLNQIDSPPMH